MDRLTQILRQIKTSHILNRMISGAFWSFTGTAFAKLIVLIAGIFCARILGKEAYGEFGMVRSTINLFVVFGYAGLGLTATKYISEFLRMHKERIPSIYILTNGFAFITGIIVTLLILVLAPYLAEHTLHSIDLTEALRVGAVLLFVTVLNGAQNGVLSGMEDFKDIARNTFVASIAESIFMLIGAHFMGVIGAILGYGVGFISLYILNFMAIRSRFKYYDINISLSSFDKNDIKILYKFSLPAALSSIMVMPIFWIVRSMLVKVNGFGELAIYEAAEQWRTIIMFIPAAVSQITLPILSSLVSSEQRKYNKVLNLNIILNGGVAFFVSLIVCLLSSYIIKLYGNGFDDKWPLIILSISTVFAAVGNVVGLSFSSKEKMWTGFMFNVIWALTFVGLTYVFLRQGYAAKGVALALLLSYVIQSIGQLFYLKFKIK